MADDEKPSGTFGDYSETNSDADTYPSFYEICDRSGFKVEAGTLVEEWTGLWVRPKDWEPRHPQEFVRGVPENESSIQVSPEADDTFLGTNDVDSDDL